MMITATSRVQPSILLHHTPATKNPLPKMQTRLKKRKKKRRKRAYLWPNQAVSSSPEARGPRDRPMAWSREGRSSRARWLARSSPKPSSSSSRALPSHQDDIPLVFDSAWFRSFRLIRVSRPYSPKLYVTFLLSRIVFKVTFSWAGIIQVINKITNPALFPLLKRRSNVAWLFEILKNHLKNHQESIHGFHEKIDNELAILWSIIWFS